MLWQRSRAEFTWEGDDDGSQVSAVVGSSSSLTGRSAVTSSSTSVTTRLPSGRAS